MPAEPFHRVKSPVGVSSGRTRSPRIRSLVLRNRCPLHDRVVSGPQTGRGEFTDFEQKGEGHEEENGSRNPWLIISVDAFCSMCQTLWIGPDLADWANLGVARHPPIVRRKVGVWDSLQEGETSIEQFIEHTRAGSPGNLHDEAWDVADALVKRMREGQR